MSQPRFGNAADLEARRAAMEILGKQQQSQQQSFALNIANFAAFIAINRDKLLNPNYSITDEQLQICKENVALADKAINVFLQGTKMGNVDDEGNIIEDVPTIGQQAT